MKTLRFFGYLNFHIQISWYPLASKLSPSNIIQRFRKTCSLTVHHVSNVILLEEHPLFCTHLNFTMGYKSHFWRLKSNCWLVRITVPISVSVLCPIPVFAAYRGAPPVSSCFAFNCFTINHMCCKCLVLTNLYSYHKWAISSYINYKSTFFLVKLPCLWLNHHFCWLQQHFSPTLHPNSVSPIRVTSNRPKVSAFTCVSLCPVGVNAVPPEEEDPEEEAVEQDCLSSENEAAWNGTAESGWGWNCCCLNE